MKDLIIITGEIGSGKTTALLNWAEERKDACGVLQPVINGKRRLLFLDGMREYNFEAETGDQEVLQVGNYKFSKRNKSSYYCRRPQYDWRTWKCCFRNFN